jgi:thioredoxin-related protein
MRKILLLIALLFATSLMAAEINWAKDFKSGIEEAAKQNKPVLFVYSSHHCKYCVMLEETTFKDKKVIEALNRDYVSIVSYTDERDYTPAELVRPGTPTLWFLLPSGEPMFQPLMGAVDAENFLKALAIVKEEFDTMKTEKQK